MRGFRRVIAIKSDRSLRHARVSSFSLLLYDILERHNKFFVDFFDLLFLAILFFRLSKKEISLVRLDKRFDKFRDCEKRNKEGYDMNR